MSAVRRSPRFVRDENRIMGNESGIDQHDMLTSDMFSPAKKKSNAVVASKKRGSISTNNTPNNSSKKPSTKKNRRETADMEDLMNGLLDDSSFTVQSDFSLANNNSPVEVVSSKKPGQVTKQSKPTTGKKGVRRETMDQGNALLNDLLNDSNTFKDDLVNASKDQEFSEKEDNANRRMTMNASCMDDLLDDLDSSNTSSFSAQSGNTMTGGRLSLLLQSGGEKKKTMSSTKKPQSAGKNVARLSIHAVNHFLDISDDVSIGKNGKSDQRRQTIDAACMDDLLNDLENEASISKDQSMPDDEEDSAVPTMANDNDISGLSFASNNFSTKIAASVSSKKGGNSSGDNRRQTIDAACMDDLLNDLENEEVSAMSGTSRNVNGMSFSESVSIKQIPSPADNQDNHRRQTIDATCMNDLLNDLEEGEGEEDNHSVNAQDLSLSTSMQSGESMSLTMGMGSVNGLYIDETLMKEEVTNKPKAIPAVVKTSSTTPPQRHGETRQETLDACAIDDLLNSTLSADHGNDDSMHSEGPFTMTSRAHSAAVVANQTGSLSFSQSEVLPNHQNNKSSEKKKSKKSSRRSSSSGLVLSALSLAPSPAPSVNDVSDLSFNTFESEDRRKTLEQSDIMKLIADEEQGQEASRQEVSVNDASGDASGYDSDGNNSIDTMALMGDVANVLNGLENDETDAVPTHHHHHDMADASTAGSPSPSVMNTSNVSELSDISFASSVRMPRQMKDQNPRRETVDSVDVAWLLEEIDNPDGSILGSADGKDKNKNSKNKSKNDIKSNSKADRDDVDVDDSASICTLDLVNAVADTLEDTSVIVLNKSKNKSKKTNSTTLLSAKTNNSKKSTLSSSSLKEKEKEKALFQSPKINKSKSTKSVDAAASLTPTSKEKDKSQKDKEKEKKKSPGNKKKSLRDSFGNKVSTRVPENEIDVALQDDPDDSSLLLNTSNVSDYTTSSMNTVGTMDLIDSVKFALEEDERNRDRPAFMCGVTDDSDNESVVSMAPLEELLRRCREQDDSTHSPAAASVEDHHSSNRAVGNKRKVISPLDAMKSSAKHATSAAAMVVAHLSPPPSQLKASNSQQPQAPQSILKSAKKTLSVNVQLNRSVVFGSPNVAEFNKASPTTSFTPMDKNTAKKMFLLPAEHAPLEEGSEGEEEEEEDEVTQENEKILEEWDRLTNASSAGSDEECDDDSRRYPGDTENYFDDFGSSPVAVMMDESADGTESVTASGRKKQGGRRRKSMLQPKLDFGDDLEAEQEAAAAATSSARHQNVLSPAAASFPVYQDQDSADADHSSSIAAVSSSAASSFYDEEDPDNVTHTVQLPANLADLLEQNQVMELAALPAVHIQTQHAMAEQSSFMEQQSMMSNQSRTVEIESDLKALLANIEGRHSFANCMLPNAMDSSSQSSSSGSNPLQLSRSSLGSQLSGRSSEGRMSLLSHLEGDSILVAAHHHNNDSKDFSSASMSMADSSGTNSVLQGLHMPNNVSTLRGRGGASAGVPVFSIHQDMDQEEYDDDQEMMQDGYDDADPIAAEEAEFLAAMEQERSVLEEDLRQLIPSRDASAYLNEESQSLGGSHIVAASPALIPSQQASMCSDNFSQSPSQSEEEGYGKDSYREELSFVETKRRMLLDQSSFGAETGTGTGAIGSPGGLLNTSEDLFNTSKNFSFQPSARNHHATGHRASISQQPGYQNLSNQFTSKTSDLMSRLKALNAGSRSNTLAQCSTPGVPNQRLSMGMRRQSFRPSLCPNIATIPTPKRKSILPAAVTAHPVKSVANVSEPVKSVPIIPVQQEVIQQQSTAFTVFEEEEEAAVPQKSISPVRESVAESVVEEEVMEDDAMTTESVVVATANTTSEPTTKELFEMDLKRFFRTIQGMKSNIGLFHQPNTSEQVRSYVISVLFDTFSSAAYGTFLTDLPRALLETAFAYDSSSSSNNDAFDRFYQDILEKGKVDFTSFDMNLRLMAMSNWDQIWINLATSAMTEMTEILMQHDKKQLVLLQQRGLIESSVSKNHAQGIMEKMLNHVQGSSASSSLDVSSDEKLLIPTIDQFKKSLEAEEEATLALEQALVDSEMLYEITNRLSFYRLVSYSSSMLELEIYLTPHATVNIKIGVQEGESNKLMITDTDVDLILEDGDENVSLSNAENSLIAAFFTHILANDDRKGPLSVANLTNITEVSRLPSLLEGVSGYIALLRKTINALQGIIAKGGSYIVTHADGNDLLIRIFGASRSSVITSSLTPFFAFLQQKEGSKLIPHNEIAQFIQEL